MDSNRLKRAQIWESAVLYLLIGSIVIVLILQAGLPIIQKNRDKAVFGQTRDQFISVDNVIQDVISEGVGSQRVVTFDVPEGSVSLKDDTLIWEMESQAKILEPRTQIEIGNVRITSDVDVSAYDYGDHISMENSHLIFNISKIGSVTSHTNIETSDIIESFYSKDTATELAQDANFTFIVDNDPDSATGDGYIELVPPGNSTSLDFAKVLVHMDADNGHNYTLSFTLDSRADFIKIDVTGYE